MSREQAEHGIIATMDRNDRTWLRHALPHPHVKSRPARQRSHPSPSSCYATGGWQATNPLSLSKPDRSVRLPAWPIYPGAADQREGAHFAFELCRGQTRRWDVKRWDPCVLSSSTVAASQPVKTCKGDNLRRAVAAPFAVVKRPASHQPSLLGNRTLALPSCWQAAGSARIPPGSQRLLLSRRPQA